MGTQSGPEMGETTVQSTSNRPPAFEQLEPRLLLSADLIGIDPLAPLETGGDQQDIVVDAPAVVPEIFTVGATPELGPEQRLTAGGTEIQVPSYSVPVLADWNADGRPDLLVGEKLDTVSGKVRVYLNSGTAAASVYGSFFYVQAAGSDLTVPASGCQGAYPRFHDWNQDGRKDLLIGLTNGTIRLYLNTGTAANPSFGDSSTIQAGAPGAKVGIDVGDRAAFDVADWNEDGAVDLVVGALDGKVRVYLNRQTAGEPDLDAPIVVQEGSSDLLVPSGRSSVDVHDFNQDGRKDLVVGNTDAQVIFYPNKGTDAAPAFDGHEILVMIAGGSRSRPYVADFNANGVPDVLVGNVDGLVRGYLCSPGVADEERIGYTTVFENISSVPNRRAVPVVAGGAGTLKSMSIYHQGGTGHAILAIYADEAGKPGMRLGTTDSTLINSTEGWQTIALQNDVEVAPGQTIWLAWVFENDPGLRWRTHTPARAISSATWSGGMPESFGAAQTEVNAIYSIYATYNEQAEATVGYSTVFPNVSVVTNRRAMPVTMQEAGIIESLTMYHQGGTGHAILAVYEDAGGVPGARLGITDSTLINSTEGWQEFALQSPVAVLQGQTIWLAWVFENDPGMRWTDGTPGRAISSATWSGAMPDSFGTSSVSSGVYSIYATYRVVTGDSTAPQPVSGLLTVAGDRQITLSWTNPADADFAGVRILRKQGAYPANPTDGTVVYSGTGNTYVDTGLTNGTTYYYAAFSFDEVPNYSSGATVTGTPQASTADKTVGHTTVFPNISSVANRRAVPYVISEDGSLESISVYHQGGTGHAILAVYADAGGLPGARLGVTNSTLINGAEGWQAIALQSPVAVSAGQTIWLAWVFENDPGMRWTQGLPGRAISTATWSGGMPDSFGASTTTTGFYSIYATYSTGLDVTAPGKVGNLTAAAGNGQISLSWINPGDADFAGVKVLRKQGSYPANPTDGTVVYSGTGTNCVDSGLTNGTKYSYAVFSFDEVPNYSGAATVAGTPAASGVDKTVGNTTVFPNVSAVTNRRAVPYVMSETGFLQSITIYHQGGTGHAILAVYADAGGLPGARLGVTDSTLIHNAEGWQTMALQNSVAVSAGQTIWLAWVFESDPGMRWTEGLPGRAISTATWSGGMPDSFGASSTTTGFYSIYATYSTSAEVPAAVTVDNGDPGASSVGGWYPSSRTGSWGPDSMSSIGAGSAFTFAAGLVPGTAYAVYAWWTSGPLRYTTVPYDIRSGNTVLDTVVVNQTLNGSQWNLLGVYTFAEMASVTITADPNSANSVNADAVRFVPVAPVELTVDNLAAGASSTGAWHVSGAPNPWGANSMVSWTPGSTFTFTSSPVPGTAYAVYAWWTQSDCRYTAVPYEIRSGGTLLDTVNVDQKVNGGRWNLLGVYTFADLASVRISAAPSSAWSTNADAIRFVPVV